MRISDFQGSAFTWCFACVGEDAKDKQMRNHRFAEEALELVQSLGCSKEEVLQLVDYVYGRPIGEPSQEVGGVMVTLGTLCVANNLDLEDSAKTELVRVWEKIDKIREKHFNKPKFGPLPQ